MKLKAHRGRRDTEDIQQLINICEIATFEEVEKAYDSIYAKENVESRLCSISLANAS
jgi:hypothetical protein